MTDAVRSIARENPKLSGVVDVIDFNATATGQRIISDDRLKALIDVLGRHRLGLNDVEPDIMGRGDIVPGLDLRLPRVQGEPAEELSVEDEGEAAAHIHRDGIVSSI